MRFSRKLLFLTATCLATGTLEAQSPDAPMAFEVASIRLAKPGTFIPQTFFLDLGYAKPPGGSFSYSFPLWGYIGFAYKIDIVPAQEMLGPQLPKWSNDNYVIEAKAEGNPSKDQMRLMMQSLLADRFKLKVHFESREGPVLALTFVRPGKLGPKLHPHSEGPPCPDSFEMIKPTWPPPPPLKASDVWPPQCGTSALFVATPNSTRIGARNTTMELLAQDIYQYGSRFGGVDKPVVDQTGLKGRFDFLLELPAGMFSFSLKPPNPDDPPPEPKGPPFLNAVREQLGLKLVRSRVEIRTLIIDHVEKPSEN
jgi:bla regulator protein blaR1